ncbi:MAG: SPASM domain-containing protein [Nitrospinae bacterium]|nr:SPASM domain-containing protein [Nitrospinota bacterium]
MQKAEKYGIEAYFPSFFLKTDENDEESTPLKVKSLDNIFPGKCYMPWKDTYFKVDGNVYLCCLFGEPLGDMNNNDFDDIWNGDKYSHVRKTILTNNPPKVCKYCMLSNGITMGNSNFFTTFLAKNFLNEVQCDDKKVHYQGSQTFSICNDAKKGYWMGKNFQMEIPVENSESRLLCIHISDKDSTGLYNEGVVIIGKDETPFSTTDEHILVKIPKNHEGSVNLKIRMRYDFSVEGIEEKVALNICKYSFYQCVVDEEQKRPPQELNTFMTEMSEGIRELGKQDGMRVVIYGANTVGEDFLKIAREAGLDVVCFFDSWGHYEKNHVSGVPVLNPDRIDDIKPDAIIISSKHHAKAIRESIQPYYDKNNTRILCYGQYR